MCSEPNQPEGLEDIKSEIYNMILNADPATKIVLMKYPTEGVDFGTAPICKGGNYYYSNVNKYNSYIESLRLWFYSVNVIDAWKNYTAAAAHNDTVHADDRTLEKAASIIKGCFENGLPLYCKNKP
jgi:hypothetical protein